jgi:uncharacterized Ntn-hydrolase superfamily protein
MSNLNPLFLSVCTLLFFGQTVGQDTFSIVALDPVTGEVGSAGASCVDLDLFGIADDSFIGQLFPGVGAINTQAWYLGGNQDNAADRMDEGMSPTEIIDWLVDNDVQGTPELRQYGIVGFLPDDGIESAGHTGSSTDDYKNHVLGPNYAIQGNILLGQLVLDSMESRFNAQEGSLACKLMAALQGANMVGADTRCEDYGTSSLFAYVKTTMPDADPGDPSFLVSVRSGSVGAFEPIDSLQVLFDLEGLDCPPIPYGIQSFEINSSFELYPNPADEYLQFDVFQTATYQLELLDILGNIVLQKSTRQSTQFDVSLLSPGIYLVQIEANGQHSTNRILIQ